METCSFLGLGFTAQDLEVIAFSLPLALWELRRSMLYSRCGGKPGHGGSAPPSRLLAQWVDGRSGRPGGLGAGKYRQSGPCLSGVRPGAKEDGGNSPSRVRFRLGWGGRERRLLPLESVLKVLIIACVVPGPTALSDPLLPDPVIQKRWTRGE